jgi:phosphoenolpyruvate synthase/pyruvate phosphate dikinase
VLTCGGKGYHLAKLHRYGFPVPNGGVVKVDLLGLLCGHWDGHVKDGETLTVDGDAAMVRRLP